MRELLKNRDYCKLLTANIVNRLGDSIDSIAFTWLTYTLTHSASLSAIVLAANVLPTVIFQPLAAPIVDKMKKRTIMVWADLLRGLLLSGFIVLLIMNLLQPWMFVVFTFLLNSIEAFRVPAGVSIVPTILDSSLLERGINVNQIAGQICTITGTALGGLLVNYSPILAMSVDLLTFILSALLIFLMKNEEKIDKEIRQNNYFENLKGGFIYLKQNQAFMIFVLCALLFNTLSSIFSSLAAAYISDILHQNANFLSIADMILTLCSLSMLIVYPKLSGKLKTSFLFTWITFGGLGLFYFGLSAISFLHGLHLNIAWVLLFLFFGLTSGIFGAYVNIMFVKVVDEAYLSRAAGVFNSLGTAIIPIMSSVIAFIVRFLEIKLIYIGTGCLAFIILIVLIVSKSCHVLDVPSKSL